MVINYMLYIVLCVYCIVDEKPALNDLQYMSIAGDDGEIHFRLMEHLQPQWRRFAIALRFPQHKIKTMEHNDDPVLDLLNEWLHGGNMEADRRQATWGVLIEALREVNYHEEVKILEKHFVSTDIGTSVVSQPGTQICMLCIIIFIKCLKLSSQR